MKFFLDYKMYKSSYTSAIIRFYQLIGLCPFLVTTSSKATRLHAIIGLLNIAILIILSIGVTYYAKYIFFSTDAIGYLTDTMQVAAPFFAHFVILVEALLSRTTRPKLWQTFINIDQKLSTLLHINVNCMTKLAIRQYFRKAVSTLLICAVIELRIMIYITQNEKWSGNWYVSIYTKVVCRSFHLFYIFFVDMVKARMEIISAELYRLNQINLCFRGYGIGNRNQMRRLKVLRNAHGDLWQAINLMKKSFGWSQLANVVSNFLCSSINLYWNYAAMYYFGSNPYWRESLLATLPPFIILAVLCYSCDACLRTVKFPFSLSNFNSSLSKIIFLIQVQTVTYRAHRIQKDQNDGALHSMVHLFSLQIMQHKFHFSIKGFFNVNFELFRDVSDGKNCTIGLIF